MPLKTPLKYDGVNIYDAAGKLLCTPSITLRLHECDSLIPEIVAAVNGRDAAAKALKAARETLVNAIQANVDLEDFDPAEHITIKQIDTAIAALAASTPTQEGGGS